jgi:serine-type D-Ala-D-Ala carboxypeptidase/endopeptidase (penicillin-binding protein 4)
VSSGTLARSWERVAGLALCVALLAGCAPTEETPEAAPAPRDDPGPPPPEAEAPVLELEPVPDPPPEPEDEDEAEEPAPVDRDQLVAWVDSLIGDALEELSEAELGVLVVDPEGRTVAAHGAERPMLPASTLKLVTAAAILTTLGPDARLRTSVETTAPIDRDGSLRGDLHLLGSGDPLLASAEYGRWVFPARPRTPLESLADDLVASGLRRVHGDIVGHAEGFGGPTVAEGWIESYYNDFNARHIGGLTVDAGLEGRYRWADGKKPDPDDRETQPTRVILELAEDPARNAADQLARALDHRGVRIDGEAVAREPDATVVGRLATVESPPMADLLRFMVQSSDNHIADTLLHTVGRVRTGEGSWERGERAAIQVLGHLGVDTSGVRLADGSGLSRDDRLTALSLVELDRAMSAGRHGEIWQSLMAVAGERGTLSTRLRGTPAQGRLLAKTGNLRDVSSLSGFVRNEHERHHFAIIANRATGTDRAVVRAFADELALLLTADLLDCGVRSASGGSDGALGRPPIALAC